MMQLNKMEFSNPRHRYHYLNVFYVFTPVSMGKYYYNFWGLSRCMPTLLVTILIVLYNNSCTLKSAPEPDWLDFFKMPYPQMVLEYPKATYKPVFNTENPVSVKVIK